jgi:hypothetical protein
VPIYQIYCSSCDRTFQGVVFAGAKLPERWVCSKCEGDAELLQDHPPVAHPLEQEHGGGCPCCG